MELLKLVKDGDLREVYNNVGINGCVDFFVRSCVIDSHYSST